jgi:hypothetical protein
MTLEIANFGKLTMTVITKTAPLLFLHKSFVFVAGIG